VKRVSRKTYSCKEAEISDVVRTLAEEYASYIGDPIDDWREYENESGDKCIIIMTPVGERLIFAVNRQKSDTYIVSIIASSWGEL